MNDFKHSKNGYESSSSSAIVSGYCEIDPKGVIQRISPDLARWILQRDQDLVGKALPEVLPEQSGETIGQWLGTDKPQPMMVELCLSKTSEDSREEFTPENPKGEWGLASLVPNFEASGVLAGAHMVVMPITQRRNEQDRLRHAAEERAVELTTLNQQLIEEIEARKMAEQHLQDSRKFAIATVNALEALVAILDDGGEIIAVNDAWRRASAVWPRSPISLGIGGDLFERLDSYIESGDTASKELSDQLKLVLRNQTNAAEVAIRLQSDGALVSYSVRISRFEFEDSAHAVIAMHDTTHLIHTQNELAQSEAGYRLLAENSTDWITRLSPEGELLYSSPAGTRMTGFASSDLLHQTFSLLIHPQDRIHFTQAIDDTLHEDLATLVEYRFLCKDGSYAWYESTLRVVEPTDTKSVREVQCATRDISQRRLAEINLRVIRSAVDQVSDAVVITEPDIELPGPKIVFCNQSFCRMTGYSLTEALGQTPRILQGKKTNRAMLDELKASLSRGEGYQGVTINYRKDGSEYDVEWAITPVRDTEGKLINWVAIQRDITQRIRKANEERHRQSELAHVARLSTMGEMASGLAHELNQPLAAITNYTRGALRRMDMGWMDRHDLRSAIDHVAAQAERAGQIIKRLRDFVIKREANREQVKITQLVGEVRSLLAHDIGVSNVSVRIEAPDDLPMVEVDSIQIEQVLLNLIRNSMEAVVEAESPDREILVRCNRLNSQWIVVEVIDQGPGLEPEQIDHIFDPFFSTKSSGMGMGLTISHTIVLAHDGKLFAHANEDQPGLCVTMHLPI